ncbi:hypothetical protein NDU88_003307 [Pleurodeles waltl]|uniref:Uncharacterized protein n=1 Tax=Pleurodeles waltl TaxID=8319 RepID=A0AAV7W5T4_PLEWA|nr:hypothetical protein NDU88_003307 [Pleurodeles waltl]
MARNQRRGALDWVYCTSASHPVRPFSSSIGGEDPWGPCHGFSWRLHHSTLRGQAFREEVRTLWEALKVVIWGVCMAKQHGVLGAIHRELADLEAKLAMLEKQICVDMSSALLGEVREKLTQ